MSHIHVLPLSHSDCLPSSTCCQVSGSSTITSPQVSYSQTLQCANIQLCSDEEFHHVYLRKITPNLLCAGTKEGGKESCEADFDGPLTCDGMLCGIFSYRDFSFEQPKWPDVYTWVSICFVDLRNNLKTKHRSRNRWRAHSKVVLTYLSPSSYHPLHSQFTILCPSQSVPLELVIYVLKISQRSWHSSVFQNCQHYSLPDVIYLKHPSPLNIPTQTYPRSRSPSKCFS